MPAKPITYQMIEAEGACHSQVDLFKKLFPNGAPLTVEAAMSVADKFNWDWAARKLLSKKGWKAYEEAMAPALKVYREATALDLKEYKEAKATAWEAYKEADALAFATAYLNDQKEE